MADEFADDLVFPESISLKQFSGSVMRKTRRFTSSSGAETTLGLWACSKRMYDAGMVPRHPRDWDAIDAFFEVCGGPAMGFKLRDRGAFQIAPPNAKKVEGAFARISATEFAFQRRRNVGIRNVYHGIAKPEAATIKVYRRTASAPSIWVLVSASNYTIDDANGRALFAAGYLAETDDLAWSGRYFYPVRFDSDSLAWQTVDRDADDLWIMGPSIPIVQIMPWPGMPVRPPDSDGVPNASTVPPAPPAPPPPPPSPPTSIALSPATMTTPAGVASPVITATLDHPATSTISLTPHTTGSGGTFSAIAQLNPGDVSRTFTRTPATEGAETLSVTNDAGLSLANTVALSVTSSGGGGETELMPGGLNYFGGASGDQLRFFFDQSVTSATLTFYFADAATFFASGEPPGTFQYYVKYGAAPTTTSYDDAGTVGVGDLKTSPTSGAAGRYHVLVVLTSTFPADSGGIQPATT